MPTTPLGLPYPDGTDPANVPADVAALATGAEGLVKLLGMPRVSTSGQESALGTEVGRLCYRTDLKKHRIRTASGWRDAIPHIATGSAPISSATTSLGTGMVSYGITFATAPHVMTAQRITPGGAILHTAIGSVTTTQFEARWIASAAIGSISIPWVAIGWLA